MIIDIHTHTFPEKIAEAAIKKMQGDCHSAAFLNGTADTLKESMKSAGIDISVVLPVATNPLKVSSINEISAEQNGRDGLLYFGCIHPDCEDINAELKRVAELKLKGVKIHPVYQNHNIDDIEFLRILDRAGELGLSVITHAGDDIGFPGVVRCSPAMIDNALKQVGNVTLICAHMGGWKNWDRIGILSEHKSVCIDTAFSLGEITPLDDGYYSPDELLMLRDEEFIKIIRTFGSERVLFGTDSPWSDQKADVERISALDLDDREKQNIFCNNAKRLLDI